MSKQSRQQQGGETGHARRSALIFRNTLSRASSATVAQVLALATIPLLLNKVSAADFGLYSLGAAFVGYFSLLSLPARSATVKFVAEFGEDNTQKIREFASSTMLVNLGVGILMAGILVTIAHFCQQLFVIDDTDVARARQILYAYAIIAPISQPLSVFGSILLGLQDYRPTSVLDVVGAVIRAGTVVLIYLYDGSILWLVFQELFFEVFRNVVLGYLLSSRYGISGFDRKLISREHFRKVFGYGGWSICYVLSTMLIYQGTRVFIGVFVSVAAIAYFQIAYMLYNVVDSVSRYLQSAVLPASSSAIVDDDHEFIRKLLIKGTRSSLCILLPLTLSITLLSDAVITNWINPEYGREAALLSQVLVSAWFFQAWAMTVIEIYRGQGDIRSMSVLVLAGSLLQIALAIILMRQYGVLGAAFSTVIYYLAVVPMQVRIAAGKIDFSISRFLVDAVFPAYFTAAVLAAILFAIIRYFGLPESAIGTVISVVISCGLMSLAMFAITARDEGRLIARKLDSVRRTLISR